MDEIIVIFCGIIISFLFALILTTMIKKSKTKLIVFHVLKILLLLVIAAIEVYHIADVGDGDNPVPSIAMYIICALSTFILILPRKDYKQNLLFSIVHLCCTALVFTLLMSFYGYHSGIDIIVYTAVLYMIMISTNIVMLFDKSVPKLSRQNNSASKSKKCKFCESELEEDSSICKICGNEVK